MWQSARGLAQSKTLRAFGSRKVPRECGRPSAAFTHLFETVPMQNQTAMVTDIPVLSKQIINRPSA